MPRLDQALALLEERTPLKLKQASKVLEDAGITRLEFHPQSLLEAARLLRKRTTLELCNTSTGAILVSDSSSKPLQIILRLARKLAGQSGVTSVFAVLDLLEAGGHQAEEQHVRRVLIANPNFEFLDEDWFWATDIKDDRNRLRNVARKILSVAAPQTVQSIREGVRRAYEGRINSETRYATLVLPPLDVMRAFFQRHREFNVEGDYVSPVIALDYARVLGETDRIMVDVLRLAPAGVMDRSTFAEGCLQRGMNENTFNLYSTYSCVLEHLGIGIWKLRGVTVDPAAVEAVRVANHLKPRQRRVLQHGWTGDGKLWIAARIPRLGSYSMVIGCPSPVQRYLIGQRFECKAKETDHRCGTVAVNEKGSSYGYGSFIHRYGLDENDILLAEFDLLTNTVMLGIGHDDVFDEED